MFCVILPVERRVLCQKVICDKIGDFLGFIFDAEQNHFGGNAAKFYVNVS